MPRRNEFDDLLDSIRNNHIRDVSGNVQERSEATDKALREALPELLDGDDLLGFALLSIAGPFSRLVSDDSAGDLASMLRVFGVVVPAWAIIQALLGALVTRDDELFTVLKQRRDLLGAVPGTLEAWLAVRGMRTLHLRVERAQANAAELARRLGDHPAVELVRYPGFGAIVSVELAAGALAADLLPRKTRLWVHATSLGGVESTLERRRRWKSEPTTVSDALVRLSVGVEDVEDLWSDLSRALDGLTD